MTGPKPRSQPGERNARAKLTWPLVRAIRAELAAGRTVSRVAARYRVSASTVARIGTGQTWREEDAPLDP